MKNRRQKRILDIIDNQLISTQEELADALKKEGYDVTQATVSRDIKELRLVKIAAGDGEYRYGQPVEQGYVQNEERLRRMISELVVSYNYSDNIVVIRTFPGNAQAIASLIDGSNWPHVIGTVAGDDTIMLVIKSQLTNKLLPEVQGILDRIKSLTE